MGELLDLLAEAIPGRPSVARAAPRPPSRAPRPRRDGGAAGAGGSSRPYATSRIRSWVKSSWFPTAWSTWWRTISSTASAASRSSMPLADWRSVKSNRRPMTAATAASCWLRALSRSSRRATRSRTRAGRSQRGPSAARSIPPASPDRGRASPPRRRRDCPRSWPRSAPPRGPARRASLPTRVSARTSRAVSARDRGESTTGVAWGARDRSSRVRRAIASIGELFLARGDDQERRPRRNAAAHEGQQPEAHLVGPVQVLQHEHQRLAGGDLLDELGHALEQRQGAVARAAAGPAMPASGSRRANSARRVGCRAPRISSSALSSAAAAGVDPRPEREDRVALVAAADQDPAALGQRVGRQRADEPGLADARFAHHGGDVPVSPGWPSSSSSRNRPSSACAPEQRRLRRGEIGWRRPDLPRRARAAAPLERRQPPRTSAGRRSSS